MPRNATLRPKGVDLSQSVGINNAVYPWLPPGSIRESLSVKLLMLSILLRNSFVPNWVPMQKANNLFPTTQKPSLSHSRRSNFPPVRRKIMTWLGKIELIFYALEDDWALIIDYLKGIFLTSIFTRLRSQKRIFYVLPKQVVRHGFNFWDFSSNKKPSCL